MVRVSAVDIVLGKLNAGLRWITISGNAGDGKTTLGFLVLKELLQNNYKVFTLYKPEEYDQIAKIDGKRMVMFDDRFGAFLADEHLIKSWFNVIRKILSFNEHDIHVIFVSRKNVVNESSMYLGQFIDQIFNPECVVDLSERKVTDKRLEILEYHLQYENVIIENELKRKVAHKETAHGFPHCCKMYSKLRSNGFEVDIEDFFESPLKFLDKTTKVLYRDNCKDLFKLMIRNDGQFDVYSVEDEDEREILLRIEKEQEGSYITIWSKGICKFSHPSVYESVLNVINEIDPLYCVQYATLSVIRQKMIMSTSDDEDNRRSPCYIIVKPIPAVLKASAERFREDVLKGDYSVFKHQLCKSIEFCQVLVSCCLITNESENGSKQFINQPGENGETILWTALKSGGMCAVQTLIKAQADVNMQDDRGRTPLHYLFQPDNFPAAVADVVVHGFGDDQRNVVSNITEMIITEGKGDVNITDDYGQTPLHYLCQLETISATAVEKQDCRVMNTIKLIITEGKGDINVKDQYGHTPLHYLFKSKTVSKKDIQWIVTEAKGDLNILEQNKSTPLHHLCANSGLQMDTVDLLITEGKGDFNKGDEYGTTPFHHLYKNKELDLDVVHRIVDTAKGEINKPDDNGITPLHVLCKRSNPMGSVLKLINQENKTDRYGNTPLHHFCRTRQGINDAVLQELKQMSERIMMKENFLGYTPSCYLNDKEGTLPFREAMIDRSAADLVLFNLEYGDRLITVLGRPMNSSPAKVNKWLPVFNLSHEDTHRSDDEN